MCMGNPHSDNGKESFESVFCVLLKMGGIGDGDCGGCVVFWVWQSGMDGGTVGSG